LLCYALIALVSALGQLAAQHYLIPQMAATLPKDQAYLAEAFYFCWLPQQSICFGCGILLYDWVERKKLPTLGVLFLLGACLSSTWNAQVMILGAGAFAVLAVNVANSFMSLLGRHSYGIYLGHFALVPAISALAPFDLVWLFALVTGLSLALSYYLIEPLIERRFNRFGHGLASRVRQQRTVTTAA
jgi:peptidoglycan/LPS O-acetylase OafA/YrhL